MRGRIRKCDKVVWIEKWPADPQAGIPEQLVEVSRPAPPPGTSFDIAEYDPQSGRTTVKRVIGVPGGVRIVRPDPREPGLALLNTAECCFARAATARTDRPESIADVIRDLQNALDWAAEGWVWLRLRGRPRADSAIRAFRSKAPEELRRLWEAAQANISRLWALAPEGRRGRSRDPDMRPLRPPPDEEEVRAILSLVEITLRLVALAAKAPGRRRLRVPAELRDRRC